MISWKYMQTMKLRFSRTSCPRKHLLRTHATHYIQPPIANISLPSLESAKPWDFPNPFESATAPPIEIAYSDFLQQVNAQEVINVHIAQDYKELSATNIEGNPIHVVLPKSSEILDILLQKDIPTWIDKAPSNPTQNLGQYLIYFLEFGLIAMMLRIAFGGGMNAAKGMGSSRAKMDAEPNTGVTFDDIAGIDNAKGDLQEVVDFLKNPEKYAAVGAKIPKGVLLTGPPGTGKTQLARAVAGEANVPFFSCSGSEFLEMFVGVGAARVRDLFQKAMQQAPCIIFIDEIDAIGKARGNAGFSSGGNDERDQTINQLLTMMDGFEKNTGVIVIAATNRPDILDEALLRPGRFDRRTTVDMPDVRGREMILKIHTRNKPLHADVELDKLAKVTVGFSGADLESLCNEAAIYAARFSETTIQSHHFDLALEKITIGEVRKTALVTEDKKRIVAVHEAGHALMGLLLEDYDIVRKVSIVPRGSAGGVTYFEPAEERLDIGLLSREYLEHRIMVAFGGRVAEELVFGTDRVTTGASADLEEVYHTAHEMITSYGFSENLGPVYLGASEGLQAEIEMEIHEMIQRLYKQTLKAIDGNRHLLDEITNQLLEKETLKESDLTPYKSRANTFVVSRYPTDEPSQDS